MTLRGPLRIAYLATEYPKVSHTFIRREIVELERRGHSVLRFAVRHGEAVDPIDREELAKTIAILDAGPLLLARALAGALFLSPLRFANASRCALQMSRSSHRGAFRHLAYLVEACVVGLHTRRAGIRHVHAHFGSNAGAVARLWSRLTKGTYSMTVHGPDEFDSPVSYSLGSKVEDSVFTVTISSFARAQVCRWIPYASWSRLGIVRCTVGEHLAQPPVSIPPDSRTLVCVGRLLPHKAQLLVIEALAALVAEGHDAHVVLVGDGEIRPLIESRIHALGLGSRVEITGWLSDSEVHDRLRQARAMVLPSFAEGLPVVIMEAFAAGRPTVSTYVGGIPELVRPGENGWLVPAGDLPALIAALRAVLETPIERLNEMGLAGRGLVQANHDTEREVDTLERYFARACGQG